MGFVTDFVKDITGAGAMEDATNIQREQFDYFKGLSKEDRKALLDIYNNGDREGFFDWRKKLEMYDKAVDPTNERDLRNVGGALRVAGSRPGDTNAAAATAMVLNAQKTQRGARAMDFFDQAFKDRFAMRQAIAGNNGPLAFQAGQNLSGTLMNQGQNQMAQTAGFLANVSPFIFAKPQQGGAAKDGTVQTNIPAGALGNIGGAQSPAWGGQSVPTNKGGMTSGFFSDQQKWVA